MIRRTAIIAACLLSAGASAQEYSWQTIDALGIKIRVHKKLKAIPLELGEGRNIIELHKRARFDPESQQAAIVKGPQPFNWGMDVLAFEPPPKFEGDPKDQEEVRRRAMEQRRYEQGARSFENLIKQKDPRASTTTFHGRAGDKGKRVKGRGDTPDHVLWEYSTPGETQSEPKISFHWYTVAASYRLPSREVALVFTWPIFKDKPDSKYLKIAKTMVGSLQVGESADAGMAGDERAQHANTPERQKIVETATAGIAGIDGWDWFTTPGCLVIFSFKPGGSNAKQRKNAEKIAAHLAAIQGVYREHFPPWEGMPEPWPVLRVCHDLETFRDYGNPPRGAESMFNGAANEIVLADGGEQDAEALAAREGWILYAGHCFKGAKLSPWFAAGFGDWFAGWAQSGKRWAFTPNKHRIDGQHGVAGLVKRGEQAELREFVEWPDARFEASDDNEDAPKWAAQSYALVDFLMRGEEKLGSQWNAAWSDILPAYVTELHKSRNAGRAARAGFGAVEWDAFQAGWETWVQSHVKRR